MSRPPSSLVYNPNQSYPSSLSSFCLLRSYFLMPPPCGELYPLWFVGEYLKLFQKGFQEASLSFGLTASECLVLSPAMCCDFFPGYCSPFPSWVHLLPGPFRVPFSGASPNPNLASLVIIINVLFTPSSRSLMKMLNETRMKLRPRGIPLDTFQQLDTLPFAVSLPFVYLASTGPCLKEAENLVFLLPPRCHFRVGILKPGRL